MSWQNGAEQEVVDLGPTRVQLLRAFGLPALTVAFGFVFALLGARGGEPNPGSLVIGAVLIGLALVSAVLEFRVLPGVLLRLTADQLVIEPRRGDAAALPLETVGALQIDYVPPIRRGFGRRPMAARAPGWWLSILPRSSAHDDLPGMHRAFAAGIDTGRLQRLREACDRFGLQLVSDL